MLKFSFCRPIHTSFIDTIFSEADKPEKIRFYVK